MLYFLIFLLCSSSLALVPRPQNNLYSQTPHDLKQLFEDFIITHGKQYAHEEEKKDKFEIFKQNVAKINRKNSDPNETAVFAINHFADLTTEEFRQMYTGFQVDSNRPVLEYATIKRNEDLPDEFDWRQKNAVTPVKDQGGCGSCWAFSAIGCVESAYFIKYNTLKEFSEQQLVDCDDEAYKCKGGWMQQAIKYIIEAGGVEGEDDYVYTAQNGTCSFDNSKVKGKVAKMLPYNLQNEEYTKQMLYQNGPIAISIDSEDFQFYHGGIMQTCKFQTISHGVVLVGYGKENGQKYWSVKNSWSETWGEKGYIRLKYDGDYNPCGMYNEYAAGAVAA